MTYGTFAERDLAPLSKSANWPMTRKGIIITASGTSRTKHHPIIYSLYFFQNLYRYNDFFASTVDQKYDTQTQTR